MATLSDTNLYERLRPHVVAVWRWLTAQNGHGEDGDSATPIRRRPGEITFSLSAVLPNLRYLPPHLIVAMPMLVLGLAAIACLARRRVRAGDMQEVRRDFAIALALTASWFSVWALYTAYTWTANPGGSTLQVVRFYVPAAGAISLLGAWLVVNLPLRASLAPVTAAAVIVVLFGLGVVPGLISTVIFALPAPIRLTHLGISSVPNALLEAGQAFGATRSQLLWKIELPAAAPSILAGVNQCIMLSLSMVVIAALVGAGGLGVPVVRALNTVQIGMGFEAGIAIVLLAIILDRVCRPRARHRH